MKICFLAPANNYHTKKWCMYFSKRGYEVHVISFVNGVIPEGTLHLVEVDVANSSDIKKLKYFFRVREVAKIIKLISPDIISVHYASSYGVVAALAGIKEYTLSVWGSDIYDFPRKSIFHKILIQYSLSKATNLLSTSSAMAEEAKKYTNRKFLITPFGVDMSLFNPDKKIDNKKGEFVVGTVKALTPKYGIDYLIKAVALVKRNNPEIPIKLRIAGDGKYCEAYKKLAKEERIDEITTWLGFISQEDAAIEWANMDVAIIYSTLDSESFGVSAVEAQACGTAVIVSDIPGLMEATKPNFSSIVVPRKTEWNLYRAIVDLYLNKSKREVLGKNGREYVSERFELEPCFQRIESFLINT